MVYTVTVNPALDYLIEMPDFQIGKINLSKKEHIMPGGKGINVSIMLKTLGIDSIALGFIGGFVGKEIERKVKNYKIETDFINIGEENSRINVKIATQNEETAINSRGINIQEKYIELLYKKMEKLEDGDILVLSGSIPKEMSEDIYQNICKKVEKKDIKIVVDTTGNTLLKTLEFHPFLIKPNQYELGEIFGAQISNKEKAKQYAEKLQQKGAKNVLVSMGSEGAVLLDENGNFYNGEKIKIEKTINTVGAGDSMVAGFIAGYDKFKNYEKAFKMGMSAGAATAGSVALAKKEEIYKLFN